MEREEGLNYSLNVNNLKTIPFDKYDKSFTFIVNNKRYETSRIVADILSPTVRKMHYTDESSNEFSFNTKDGQTEKDDFDSFLNLATFNNVEIDFDHQIRYSEYFYELGNIDECIRIQTQYSSSFTIENAINRLLHIIEITEKFNKNTIKENDIQELIDYIAQNFEEFNKYNLKKIKIEYLELIIRNNNLKLEDEDSLMRLLLELYKEDQ